MKSMRLMVSHDVFAALAAGKPAFGLVQNDYVSTSRKDPERLVHQYCSRHELCLAALRAAKDPVAVQVFQSGGPDSPCRARLVEVSMLSHTGMDFWARLEPRAAAARKEGGAR